MDKVLNKILEFAVKQNYFAGGIIPSIRGSPNFTQAKDLSVSAIAVIAQFTFSGALTEKNIWVRPKRGHALKSTIRVSIYT